MMKSIFSISLLAMCLQLLAQVTNNSSLTIDDIMKGEDFVGSLPSRIDWSEDSKYIYFNWNPDNDTVSSTYKANIETGTVTKMSFEELKSTSEDGEYTGDRKYKVFDKQGDLFIQDLSSYGITSITRTNERESNPTFSGDEKSIIFSKDNNLFSWSIEEGSLKQLTDFRPGSDNDRKSSDQDKWLENDQLAYFDILEKRKNEDQARDYRRDKIRLDRPKTIYLKNNRLLSIVLSTDQKYVVYLISKPADDKNTDVPNYVTTSGYTENLNARSKVGSPQDTYETWIYSIDNDTTYQIESDQIEGIYDKPAYKKEYAEKDKYEPTYENPRDVLIGLPTFSADGKAILNVRASDYKDRWIMLLDLESGKLKLIDRQHDDAWIAGPGIGWFSRVEMGWIDNENIWFKSEKTGFAHLYTANVRSGKTKALTKGDYEVFDVQLSKNKEKFYFTSNQVSPHEQHFYHMDINGKNLTQITTKKGGHEVTISPNEEYLAVRYSYSNQPWELFVMPNKAGAEMKQLTESTTKEFEAYTWRVPEIIRFKASDGEEVPASLYKPTDATKNGAAVIFVHGAGYLQNVHNWWPSYYREYMFHNLLADNGYTVLAIDFRASAGYGRDWRTAIYRHMGGKDLDDQVDGAKYLVENHGIDSDRIGIYGGSYGGFITLMAMFKYPDVFESGAALRSVTDWAHYNHGYTARILNTPVEDSIAYAKSSPLYFAEGLEGNLLILHGMIDRNVHFQDVVRLSQRLIELKKEDWEMALFPLEGHGFVESSSWSDEYRRIFKLFEETIGE